MAVKQRDSPVKAHSKEGYTPEKSPGYRADEILVHSDNIELRKGSQKMKRFVIFLIIYISSAWFSWITSDHLVFYFIYFTVRKLLREFPIIKFLIIRSPSTILYQVRGNRHHILGKVTKMMGRRILTLRIGITNQMFYRNPQ